MTSSTRSPRRIRPPTATLFSLAREATGLLEIPQLAWSFGDLRKEPAGDGSTVIVLPGFGADDRSTWPLRRFLTEIGYDARGWGRGTHTMRVEESLFAMRDAVEECVSERGQKLFLVGWSLGGYVAREVARELPDAIRHVVTLGSPVIGGPKYTSTARVARAQGLDIDAIEAAVDERKSVPLRVPLTAIYSRTDGIVAWQACVDPEGDAPIEHVEVETSHLGLGYKSGVYRVIARRLAGAGD
ncbi:MAG: esterase/lipase family protein [Myxococcota bacterium]